MTIPKHYLNQRQYALRWGVSVSLVFDCLRDGILDYKMGKKVYKGRRRIKYINVITEDPKFKRHLEYLREKRDDTTYRKADPPIYPGDSEFAAPDSAPLPESKVPPSMVFQKAREQGMSIHQARAAKEVYLARRAKLHYEKEKGSLVPIDDLVHAWEEIGMTIQKSLMAIPDRTSQLVAAEKDPMKCHELLSREIRFTLKNLTTDLANIAKRKSQEVHRDSGDNDEA